MLFESHYVNVFHISIIEPGVMGRQSTITSGLAGGLGSRKAVVEDLTVQHQDWMLSRTLLSQFTKLE